MIHLTEEEEISNAPILLTFYLNVCMYPGLVKSLVASNVFICNAALYGLILNLARLMTTASSMNIDVEKLQVVQPFLQHSACVSLGRLLAV